MSVLFSAIAWATDVSPSARKIVLLKLADNANDKGVCWPSYDYLAAHCGMSKRSVQRHVEALEQGGFLARKRRSGGPNNNLTNMFILTLKMSDIEASISHLVGGDLPSESDVNSSTSGGDNLSTQKNEGRQPCRDGVTTVSLRGDTTVTLNHHRTIIEPSLKDLCTTRSKKPDFIREIFNVYPAHRRGGTDAQFWRTWKCEKLTERDAMLVMHWLSAAAESDPQWRVDGNGQYVQGLTKFVRERLWLTPVPVARHVAKPSLDMDDVSWADDLNEGLL